MIMLIDTSFLVSLTLPSEKSHQACVDLAKTLFGKQLIVPMSVLPEAAYMIKVRAGDEMMQRFVRQMGSPLWWHEPVTEDVLKRTAELLKQYTDLKLDYVDGTLIAIAETLNVDTVLTLDRRDFDVVRPKHTPHFTILPEISTE